MTTHLLKPGFISSLTTRCGIQMTDPLPRKHKGDLLGSEDGIEHVDCAGCLRGLIVEMRLEGTERDAAAEWLAGGDTGTSSMTIWSVMTGRPMPAGREPCNPWDPGDFGRCHRLLEKFPEWRARLGEVAAKHPAWAGLVAHWDELTALYVEEYPTGSGPKLYARMKELLP